MSSNLSFYNTFKYYIKPLTTSTFLNPLLSILPTTETKKNTKGFLREKQRKKMILIKLKSKRFSRNSSSKVGNNKASSPPQIEKDCGEIKWEVRPGGMLVQKRESNKSVGELITIRVSTVSKWHDISIEATSTFGMSHLLFYHIFSLPMTLVLVKNPIFDFCFSFLFTISIS